MTGETSLRTCIGFALMASAPIACPAQARPADSSSSPATRATTCQGADGHAAAFGNRRTFLLAPAPLLALKAQLRSDPTTAAAYATLIERADAALKRGPYTVTDKRALPPSGDRHDYMSVGPYWWPDPATLGGLPYVRRDGEVNPDRLSDKYDTSDLEAMSKDVELLGRAYFFSDDRRYAAHAASLVRGWFLDPATRMNPNLAYSQAIPGRVDGRAEGIIDTVRLQRVIESIGLIGPAGVLSAAEQAGLERWFGDYVAWMQSSAIGKQEDAADNNHALWFDAQVIQFALFARRPALARAIVDAFPGRRIAAQFATDGTLPEELTRTRSLHYSIYALQAAYDVADLGGCVGADLWHYADSDGRSLKRATDFLVGYAGRLDAWPYPEQRRDAAQLDELLRRAASAWPGNDYPRAQSAELRRYFTSESAIGKGASAPSQHGG